MVKEEKKNLTSLYSLVLAAYWMSSCCCVGMSIVYLKSLSYNNFEAGVIVAMASLFGTLLGLSLSSLIDRKENISSKTFPVPMIIIQGVMLGLMFIISKNDLFTAVIYIIYSLICTALGSLLIKVYVDLNHQGYPIDYSFARGIGSFAYVIISLILGRLMSTFSERVILDVAAFIVAFELITVSIISGYIKKTDQEAIENNGSSMAEFMRHNHGYMKIIIGVILMFYAHCIATSFMVNIVTALGGNNATVGYLTGFMAAVEIPVALLYSKFFKDHTRALKIASISMSLKAIAIALAFNIPLLFLAMVLQAPSFALYMTCIVPYAEKNIAYRDSAKAQSLAFSAMNIASIIASIIGGCLFDLISVRNNLYFSTVISILGTFLVLYTLGKEKNGKDPY